MQLKLPLYPEGDETNIYGEQLGLDLDFKQKDKYGPQLEFPFLIEVIKIVDNELRPCKIYSSIVSRMASNNEDKNLVFREKNPTLDKDFIKENNITNYPITMVLKNGILKKTFTGILATPLLMQEIEEAKYL